MLVCTLKISGSFLHFVTIFHLLQQGCSLTNYKSMWQLFIFFKVPNNPWYHWSDSNAWIMVECMHKIVLTNRQMTIQNTRFFSNSINEVTTVDYQSWLGVHVYLVDG
jgi:hypothetical protein